MYLDWKSYMQMFYITALYMIQVMAHSPDDHHSPAFLRLIYNNNDLEGASRMYHGAKNDWIHNGKFNN